MGEVIPLREDPNDAIAAEIRQALCARGSTYQQRSTLRVTVREWRAIARRVGRQLKRPIRTVLTQDGVHAVLDDWPRDDREQAITNRALRRAVESVQWPPPSHPPG